MAKRRSSSDLYAAAAGLMEAAQAQSRVEMALSEARIAKLKAAAELEQAGRQKEADRLVREVEREQRREWRADERQDARTPQHGDG